MDPHYPDEAMDLDHDHERKHEDRQEWQLKLSDLVEKICQVPRAEENAATMNGWRNRMKRELGINIRERTPLPVCIRDRGDFEFVKNRLLELHSAIQTPDKVSSPLSPSFSALNADTSRYSLFLVKLDGCSTNSNHLTFDLPFLPPSSNLSIDYTFHLLMTRLVVLLHHSRLLIRIIVSLNLVPTLLPFRLVYLPHPRILERTTKASSNHDIVEIECL